jgi:hypothetical protein
MTKPTKQQYLENAKSYAISRGGECLATEYLTAKTKTQWKCANKNYPSWHRNISIINKNS